MIVRFAAALLAGGGLNQSARAQSVADFYRGKTISMVVSSATGGGYDTLSRIVAKHMVRHMPGAPNIVVRNMPGQGARMQRLPVTSLPSISVPFSSTSSG